MVLPLKNCSTEPNLSKDYLSFLAFLATEMAIVKKTNINQLYLSPTSKIISTFI